MTHDDDADTLLIVYQRGFADGKQSVQRKSLTDEQISAASKGHMTRNGFARAIEAAHGIKDQPEQEPVAVKHCVMMHGNNMAFKIGNQQFTLDFQPSEPGEFEFMENCLIHALHHFALSVQSTPPTAQPAPVQEPVAIDGNTSDGYHTFNELYEFRKAYNAALFNEWAAGGKCSVHKSWRHHDNDLCFGGGWFIVVAVLPQGQISNHYAAKDWDLFAVPEVERALFEFDGHTGADVVERLKTYTTQPAAQRPWVGLTEAEIDYQTKKDDHGVYFALGALWAEAKLKERNT